jgi:hypothetical protein
MVILRVTRKLRELRPEPVAAEIESDTALGDWYVNRFVVDRRPLLLVVSSQSLLPIVIPAREVKSLSSRLAQLVADRLNRLQVPPGLIDRETGAMNQVLVAKTTDRSVLGTMVDFAHMTTYILPEGNWGDADLIALDAELGMSPCRVGRSHEEGFFPAQKTVELLKARWLASRTGFDFT